MTLSRNQLLAAGVLWAVAAGAARAQSSGPFTIAMQPLGSLGGAGTAAVDINEAGHIVGASETAEGQTQGFVFTPAGMVGIPPLAGDERSTAYLINNAGLVFAISQTDENRPDRLIVWKDGVGVESGSLGRLLTPIDANDRGHMVGVSNDLGRDDERCVFWSQERQLHEIVPFPGATGCFFMSLNASGQAVGYARNSDDLLRGFLYDHDTGAVVLPELSGLYASQALAINDLGHIVLIVTRAIDEFTTETRTYLWSPGGSLVDIGVPIGAVATIGLAINNLDHIVGGARLSDESVVAFRWTAAEGARVLTFDGAENQIAVAVDDNSRVLSRTSHYDGTGFVTRLFLWTEEAGVIDLNVPGAHSTFPSPLLGRGINNSGDIPANFWTSSFGVTQAVVWQVRSRPPTPQEAVGAIAEDVASLPDAGLVSEGEANALLTKLDAALARLAKGKPKEAANVLDAFVNQVEAMVRSGRLTAGEGQQLIDAAQTLIAQLRG